jgi:hypothetical protein
VHHHLELHRRLRPPAAKAQSEFKTRGVHANQVFAAIGAAMRMLNLVVHWSLQTDDPQEAGRQGAEQAKPQAGQALGPEHDAPTDPVADPASPAAATRNFA